MRFCFWIHLFSPYFGDVCSAKACRIPSLPSIAPFKALYKFDAINITLGLPFVRISPDHVPNEKMLGKNISSPLSLFKAISFLERLK